MEVKDLNFFVFILTVVIIVIYYYLLLHNYRSEFRLGACLVLHSASANAEWGPVSSVL